IKLVAPRGDLDMAAAEQMKRTLVKLVDDGNRKVLVDLGQVGYVDSSGMGALVASLKHARAAGGELRLCALQDDVRAIFEMTRLNKAVIIPPSRSEALGAWALRRACCTSPLAWGSAGPRCPRARSRPRPRCGPSRGCAPGSS